MFQTFTKLQDCIVRVFVVVWQLEQRLHMQSVPITTEVVSSNPAQAMCPLIQNYVIKFCQ